MKNYKIFIILTVILFSITAKAAEIETTALYDGTNTDIKTSFNSEKLYFSFQKGVDTGKGTKYFSVVLKDKKMIEINDEMYYVISYSGQFDNDRIIKVIKKENEEDDIEYTNSFFKLSSDIKLAKYINNNLFINFYLDNEYKNYFNYPSGESVRGATRVEVKFPKNNLNFNLKLDTKYFFNVNKLQQEVGDKTVTIRAKRLDTSIEARVDKTIGDRIYFEAGNEYGRTNNNIKYKDKITPSEEMADTNNNINYKEKIIPQSEEMPDVNTETMDQAYVYLGCNVYSGNAGAVTLYGNFVRAIYMESKVYYDNINLGANYTKDIKYLGEFGVSGNYETVNKDYSISTYLKKSF